MASVYHFPQNNILAKEENGSIQSFDIKTGKLVDTPPEVLSDIELLKRPRTRPGLKGVIFAKGQSPKEAP